MEKAQFDRYKEADLMRPVIRADFDQTNRNWCNNQDYNHLFAKNVMNFMFDKIMAQGYLFVNDVWDAFGIARTPEGQLLGWKKGDNKMDFSFTSDGHGGAVLVLKNVQFIWHTLGD